MAKWNWKIGGRKKNSNIQEITKYIVSLYIVDS